MLAPYLPSGPGTARARAGGRAPLGSIRSGRWQFSAVRAACQWPCLPHEYASWQTVCWLFHRWRLQRRRCSPSPSRTRGAFQLPLEGAAQGVHRLEHVWPDREYSEASGLTGIRGSALPGVERGFRTWGIIGSFGRRSRVHYHPRQRLQQRPSSSIGGQPHVHVPVEPPSIRQRS
jgi:hypothetical protein